MYKIMLTAKDVLYLKKRFTPRIFYNRFFEAYKREDVYISELATNSAKQKTFSIECHNHSLIEEVKALFNHFNISYLTNEINKSKFLIYFNK